MAYKVSVIYDGHIKTVKNSITLIEALENWRDFRLLHVANLCVELNDPFRSEFGKVHLEFAQAVNHIIDNKNASLEILEWLSDLKENFNSTNTFNKGEQNNDF